MDFYAGSGTTGHVVHNKQVNGEKVKYILVQIPEKPKVKSVADKEGYKKISDITIDRNKIIVNAFLTSPQSISIAEDIKCIVGFKVYTLCKSSFPRTDLLPIWRNRKRKTWNYSINILPKRSNNCH